MPESIATYIVDSFTDAPFRGNPAGVCLLDQDIHPDLMLQIAQELGLSETAFLRQIGDEKYSIRFFSPKMEIPLCGHATLASAKIIFERSSTLQQVTFTNIQNLQIPVFKNADAIKIEFPIYQTVPAAVPAALLSALGIHEIVNSRYNAETNILLLEISDSHELAALTPNFEKLISSHDSINGVLITAPSRRPKYDFESRYFWPWSGTNEDPVTGGTHTFLTTYWGEKLGKTKMHSFQCSKRSGFMEVELVSDDKMTVSSQAQIVFEGILKL